MKPTTTIEGAPAARFEGPGPVVVVRSGAGPATVAAPALPFSTGRPLRARSDLALVDRAAALEAESHVRLEAGAERWFIAGAGRCHALTAALVAAARAVGAPMPAPKLGRAYAVPLPSALEAWDGIAGPVLLGALARMTGADVRALVPVGARTAGRVAGELRAVARYAARVEADRLQSHGAAVAAHRAAVLLHRGPGPVGADEVAALSSELGCAGMTAPARAALSRAARRARRAAALEAARRPARAAAIDAARAGAAALSSASGPVEALAPALPSAPILRAARAAALEALPADEAGAAYHRAAVAAREAAYRADRYAARSEANLTTSARRALEAVDEADRALEAARSEARAARAVVEDHVLFASLETNNGPGPARAVVVVVGFGAVGLGAFIRRHEAIEARAAALEAIAARADEALEAAKARAAGPLSDRATIARLRDEARALEARADEAAPAMRDDGPALEARAAALEAATRQARAVRRRRALEARALAARPVVIAAPAPIDVTQAISAPADEAGALCRAAVAAGRPDEALAIVQARAAARRRIFAHFVARVIARARRLRAMCDEAPQITALLRARRGRNTGPHTDDRAPA